MKYSYKEYYSLLDRCANNDGDLYGTIGYKGVLNLWNDLYHPYMKRKTHGKNDLAALKVMQEMLSEMEQHILETKER